MAASIDLRISRRSPRTAAYKVHRPLGQKSAGGGLGAFAALLPKICEPRSATAVLQQPHEFLRTAAKPQQWVCERPKFLGALRSAIDLDLDLDRVDDGVLGFPGGRLRRTHAATTVVMAVLLTRHCDQVCRVIHTVGAPITPAPFIAAFNSAESANAFAASRLLKSCHAVTS